MSEMQTKAQTSLLTDALNFVINRTIEQQEAGDHGDAEIIRTGEAIIDRALKAGLVRPLDGTPYVTVVEGVKS